MKLPPEARNQPVFHVSELETYRQCTFHERHQHPPPVEEEEFSLELTQHARGREEESDGLVCETERLRVLFVLWRFFEF